MKRTYPWIACAIGLTIILLLIGFDPQNADTTRKLPLLTALFMAEFGFLVNAAAVFVGIKLYLSKDLTKTTLALLLVNFLLAMYLLLNGINLWLDIAQN